MKQFFVFILLLATFLQSCITKKVVTTGVGSPSYNNIVSVNPAQYNKQKTKFARAAPYVSALLGAGAGAAPGAAIGSRSGAVIGAVVGGLGTYTAVALANRFTKTGIINAKSTKKWVNKYNKTFKKEYIPFDIQSPVAFQMIDKNMETNGNYKLYNVKDADNFFSAFPKNKTFKSLAQNAHTIMWRREIPEFINKYGNDDYNFEYKTAYINRSENYSNLDEAENRYPGVVKDLENKYFGFVSNLPEAKSFLKKYPSTSKKDALQDKSITFIKNVGDVYFIKDLFQESLKKELVVTKALSVISDFDIPRLVDLLPDAENISIAKIRYINANDDFKSYSKAVNKYPEIGMQASTSANFSNYDWCWDEVKKLGWAKELGLQESTFKKVRNDILNNYVKGKISNSPKSSISDAMALRDYILYDPFLKPVASEFKSELDGYVRKAEFEVAKAEGVESLIVFCERYPGTDEARSAKGELDKFVRQNTAFVAKGWWAKKGDRNWTNDLIDGAQGLLGGTALFNIVGGEKLNLFTAGQIINNSNKTLPVEIKTKFNIINRQQAYISIIKVMDNTTHKQVEATPFYLCLKPGETLPFINLFQNFREGGGANLLIFGGSDRSEVNPNNPYELEVSFYPEKITERVWEEQKKLITQVAEKGNIPIKKSNVQMLAEAFGGDENSLYNNLRSARNEAIAQVERDSERRKVELEQRNVQREANAQKEKELKEANAKQEAETQKAANELQAKRQQWDDKFKTCVDRVTASVNSKLGKKDKEFFGLLESTSVTADVYTSPTFKQITKGGSGVYVNDGLLGADCKRESLRGAIDCFCEQYLKKRP